MKKFVRVGIVIVLFLFLTFSFVYVFFSVKINNVLNNIYNNKEYISLNKDVVVSEEIYNLINPKKHFDITNISTKDKHNRTPLLLTFGFKKIKVYYKYSYKAYDEQGELVAGCADIPVQMTINFYEGRLHISDYRESLF